MIFFPLLGELAVVDLIPWKEMYRSGCGGGGITNLKLAVIKMLAVNRF